MACGKCGKLHLNYEKITANANLANVFFIFALSEISDNLILDKMSVIFGKLKMLEATL